VEAAEMVSMLVLFSMMDVGRQRQMNANREVKVTLNPFGISRFRLSNVSPSSTPCSWQPSEICTQYDRVKAFITYALWLL